MTELCKRMKAQIRGILEERGGALICSKLIDAEEVFNESTGGTWLLDDYYGVTFILKKAIGNGSSDLEMCIEQDVLAQMNMYYLFDLDMNKLFQLCLQD